MNVIVVVRKGVMDTPILIKKNSDADAMYENLTREMLGDDFEYVVGRFFDDMIYDRVNHYLKDDGSSINYFNLKTL